MADLPASAPPRRPLSGVIPIAPTTFHDDGSLDLASQRRAVEFLVEAGVDAICINANFSEQFSLTDEERDRLTDVMLEQVAGRVPVIATTSHFSTRVAAERSRRAASAGAAMVMLMPPYHGATLRVGNDAVRAFFAGVAEAIAIPILFQDNPMSGTTVSAEGLAAMARDIPNLRYFKMETADAADKLRTLIRLGGDLIEGPFDGEEGITLIADLDAGATGTMPGGIIPDVFGTIVRRFAAGDRAGAVELYEHWLPLINYENRHCGLHGTKVLMHEAGIISSEAVRAPLAPLSSAIRAGLIDLARRLDAPILRHGGRSADKQARAPLGGQG